MFDRGSGPPVVVVPGLQGRWEWMRPALAALAGECRTISYSLCGDFGSGARVQPALGFDNYTRQLDAVLDRAGLDIVSLCGVSYGGVIAVRYAATRPERVESLTIVSAPAPGWQPNDVQQRYVAHPWLSAPAFTVSAPLRLWPEISAALPDAGERWAFAVRHALRVLAAPMIPSLMASRIDMQQRVDFRPDCERIAVPTLVVTGEPGLDRVVPVEVTRSYVTMIPGARYEMMERTGHIGLVTRPAQFARLVSGFVHANHH